MGQETDSEAQQVGKGAPAPGILLVNREIRGRERRVELKCKKAVPHKHRSCHTCVGVCVVMVRIGRKQ